VELFFDFPEKILLKESRKTDFIYGADFDTGRVTVLDMKSGSREISQISDF